MKNVVFWDVALCRSWVNRRFGGMYRHHLQGRKIRSREPASAGGCIPEDDILQSHRCKNLKSYITHNMYTYNLHLPQCKRYKRLGNTDAQFTPHNSCNKTRQKTNVSGCLILSRFLQYILADNMTILTPRYTF
jgi:hypothetical protein